MSALLTPKQAAERLAISETTLATWRSREPERLPFVRLSARAVRYREQDLDAFIEAHLQGGAS